MGEACTCGCRHGAVAGPVAPRGPAVGSEETVEGVVGRSPGAAAVLRGLGIDTCCGGRLTLSQAAASAGVPVETVLAALGAGGRDAT